MAGGELLAGITESRLFRRPPGELNAWQVIKWWELRRIPYNLIVGATGIVAVVIMATVAAICQARIGVPMGIPDPPIIAVFAAFVFGVMANVCFTLGWAVELGIAQVWGSVPTRFGELAFALGLLGSMLLALLPAVVTVVVAVATLAGWLQVPNGGGEFGG